MNTTDRIPALAAAAATALARLPVDAQDRTEKPSDLAAAAAAATTRPLNDGVGVAGAARATAGALNECVGLPLSSLTHSDFIPSPRARLSARTRRVQPTPRLTTGATGSRAP